MKKITIFVCIFMISSSFLLSQTIDKDKLDLGYYEQLKGQNISINVYNWGEYISDGSDDSWDVNKEFEELTGIKVNYTTYASNEELYVKLKIGGVSYDVIVPSDYMISRLIKESLLQKIDTNKIRTAKNVGKDFFSMAYDPFGQYSVAYTWGITGIIYNTKIVTEPENAIDWDILFNEKYKGQILMYFNPRDAFAVAYAKLGYSLNTTNASEIREAAALLKDQKSLVQAYVMDEIYDKMESEEAAIGVYYAGDSLTMMDNNSNLNFVIPSKGANLFVDAMCIPSSSENVLAAHIYISFMNEAEIALANASYTQYASPNEAAVEIMDDDIKNNKLIYPDESVLANAEVYFALPDETNKLIDELWNGVLTTDELYKGFVVPLSLLGICIMSAFIIVLSKRRKREQRR